MTASLPLADFALRTIPRRFSREEKTELLFYILTIDITTWKLRKCDFTADKFQTEQKENKDKYKHLYLKNFAPVSCWNRLTQKKTNKTKTNSHNNSKEEKTRFELSREWLNEKKNLLRFAHFRQLFHSSTATKRKNDF